MALRSWSADHVEPQRARDRARGDADAVVIRPLSPADERLVRLGFERLSAESRHFRYGIPLVDPARALGWVGLLHDGRHLALGACSAETGEPVGVARFVRDGTFGEVAVTVVDAWQGRGVGTALLGALLERGREQGIATLSASVMLENRRAIRLARRFGGRASGYARGGVFEFELPVTAPSPTPIS
jgi:RimJ/RimL family protein N-acetyltransferase